MDDLIAEITKNPISTYAAVVATIAVVISLWVASRDRARIIVTGKNHNPPEVPPGLPSGVYRIGGPFIQITVSNFGRRPRTISHVGVRLKDGSQMMADDYAHSGPRAIAEGTSVSSWIILCGGESKLSLDSVESVWAKDQTGKVFRGKLELALEESELRS
jgi:hypothetical protein